MRYRNLNLINTSTVETKPAKLQIDSAINVPISVTRNETKTSKEGKTDSRESNTSCQLNYTASVEVTKEHAKISLFSKIKSASSDESQKQNENRVSPTGLQKSVACAATEAGSRNEQSSTKLISNARELLSCEAGLKEIQIPSRQRVPLSNQHLLTTDGKKCKSVLETEFRSQKVLFTTPSAVSKPIISLMNSIGFDDSLSCYKSSPVTLSACTEKIHPEAVNYSIFDENRVTGAKQSNEPTCDGDCKERDMASHDCIENKKICINGRQFIVRDKIGQGGSSSVFSAEHTEKKLKCALKVLTDALYLC